MNAQRPQSIPTDQQSDAQAGPPEQPGALHGQVWFAVQTVQAQRLIHGRKAAAGKPAIIGLVGFADRLRILWLAARRDDPYADWWLIQVHEAIEREVEYVRHWQQEIHALLHRMPGMDIYVAVSTKPYRIALQFANPYAYQAALLLSEYDALACRVLTAHHVGLLDNEARNALIKSCARRIRAIFTIPQRYRLLKIDREAVRRNRGRSSEARQHMGNVPEDILSGERQAPFTPRKGTVPRTMAGPMELHPASSPAMKRPVSENDDG